MLEKQITKNFNLSEFIKSDTADKKKIDNTPTVKVIENIEELCIKVLQPIRDYWQEPIKISSGFRCKKLNDAVGGAKNSSHLYGAAADFSAKNKKDNKKLFDLIKIMMERNIIEVHQLIWEKGTKEYPQWIHISINCDERPYRKNQILYLY